MSKIKFKTRNGQLLSKCLKSISAISKSANCRQLCFVGW